MALTQDEAAALLAGRLAVALRGLPDAYERLRLFLRPGSRPSDQGSKQRHGDSIRDPLAITVEDLLSERVKPDVYPARVASEIALDQVWDPSKGDPDDPAAWVRRRRLGVLPTLSQWCRTVDADLWDAGIEHDEYGLTSCGAWCWLAPIRARADRREGPCPVTATTGTGNLASHWTRPTGLQGVTDECEWLLEHVEWMTGQEWWPVIVDELGGLYREIRGITGDHEEPAERTCLKPGCGWRVVEEAGGAWFKCTGCGAAWGRLELHRMAERRKPKTLAELTGPTGLSIVTLRRYDDAGKITPLPEKRGTAKLYDLDHVMEATQTERYKPERGTRGRFRVKTSATPSRTV